MDEREQTCCFTGPRPQHLPWGTNEEDPRCVELKFQLRCSLEGLIHEGWRHFIGGMAIGCDMYFAEAVLDLKRAYPDITLEAAIPCGTQPDRWSLELRQRYNRLLDRCDSVTVLQIAYTPDCMLRRNRYMVDRSSLLLACHNGRPGGSMNTLLYAMEQGVRTIQLDIDD